MDQPDIEELKRLDLTDLDMNIFALVDKHGRKATILTLTNRLIEGSLR